MKKLLLATLLVIISVPAQAYRYQQSPRSNPSVLRTFFSFLPLGLGLYLLSNSKKISVIPTYGKPYTYTEHSKLGLILTILGAYTSYTAVRDWADSDEYPHN